MRERFCQKGMVEKNHEYNRSQNQNSTWCSSLEERERSPDYARKYYDRLEELGVGQRVRQPYFCLAVARKAALVMQDEIYPVQANG
jgi:hypothetical protein